MPDEIAFAWVRSGIAEPWHLVRGLTPLGALHEEHIVAPCGAALDVSIAAERPLLDTKVCRFCHEAAGDLDIPRSAARPS